MREAVLRTFLDKCLGPGVGTALTRLVACPRADEAGSPGLDPILLKEQKNVLGNRGRWGLEGLEAIPND